MKKSFFFISWILLVLCFLPALNLPFVHHDNARYFDKFYNVASACPAHPDYQYTITYFIGRPLTAEIQQIIYMHVSHLRDLTILRWLTVTIFALCAGLLANIFYTLGLTTLESLGLSVAIFILPGAQDTVIMTAIQSALAILIALMAYGISSRPCSSILDNVINATAVFSLGLTSMFFYPQLSFFIFTPLLVKYLITPSQQLRLVYKETLRLALIFIITAIFYYWYVKTFISLNGARAGSYSFTIDLNFFYWKFMSVFSTILPIAFNFWDFHSITWIGLTLMVLTIVLLRGKAIFCMVMILATTSFWLLARTDTILHRIFYVTSAMALISFLISIRQSLLPKRKTVQLIIITAMVTGLLIVHKLTFLNAVNYNSELSFIQHSLLSHRKAFSRIHIIMPSSNARGYNGQPTVGDTFNAKTASFDFTTDMLNLLRAAMVEDGISTLMKLYSCEGDQQKCVERIPKGYQLLVTHSYKNQPVFYSPDMLLIDMSKL